MVGPQPKGPPPWKTQGDTIEGMFAGTEGREAKEGEQVKGGTNAESGVIQGGATTTKGGDMGNQHGRQDQCCHH
jgi:hypothetical protein